MAADPTTAGAVDELLNYDVSDDDIFGDHTTRAIRDDKATLSPRAAKRKLDDNKENVGLGLDEEVKITKKRKPTAKLDEARLLTQPGIPKLRALARSGKVSKRLHFKGKGHEFSDAGRLLNYYQLWLDNLYPRAKFADGLQLVEKAGHTKRMAVMRKEWIDEGKPGYARDRALRAQEEKEDEEMYKGDNLTNQDLTKDVKIPTNKSPGGSLFGNRPDAEDMFFPDARSTTAPQEDEAPADDELDALLAEQSAVRASSKHAAITIDSEGEDDLDALLAEQHTRRAPTTPAPPSGSDDEDDELDALLAEQASRPPAKTPIPQAPVLDDEDEDNDIEEDLDAPLAQQETGEEPELPPPLPTPTVILAAAPSPDIDTIQELTTAAQPSSQAEGAMFSSSPLPNPAEDLDALFAEHEASKGKVIGGNKEKEKDEGDEKVKEKEMFFSSSPIPNDE